MPTLTKPQCDRIVATVLLIFTAFRIWYSGSHELVPDESYYWQWSRHLAAGYYDNTPLLAFVIRFFTALLGTSELTVRLGAIVSAVVASIFMYYLGIKITSPQAATGAVVIANIIPLFAGGAVLMTQDPIQLALWSATAFVVWLAIEPGDGRSTHAQTAWWIFAGILAGLTTLAKLNGIMILPAVLLYLLLTPDRRYWLQKPAPYVACIVALAMMIPFYEWNAGHLHAFSLHAHSMASRIYDHGNWPGRAFLDYLGSQAILISPGFFVIYLVTLAAYRPGTGAATDGRRFLWCLTIIPLVVVAGVALHNRVEANWSVAGYISAIILIGDWVDRNLRERRRVGAIALSFALAILISGAAIFFPDHPKALWKRTNDLYGWQTMADRIAAEQKIMGPGFVCGTNYRMPSEAAFYLPGRPVTYSLFLKDRANEYLFWNDPNKLIGQNAILVNDDDDTKPGETDDTLAAARAVFQHVAKQSSLKVYRAPYRDPVRTIQVYRCYGFKGYDRRRWQNGW